MAGFTLQQFEQQVRKLIDDEVARAADEELREASNRLIARLPEITAKVTIAVGNYVSFERLGTQLVINVKVEKE